MSSSSSDSSHVDGDLQFLADSVYFALLDNESPSNWSASKEKRTQDGLFMERLESFIDGQLKDIEAFANREQKPINEVRRLVAIPHVKYVFSLDTSLPFADSNRPAKEQPLNLTPLKSTLSRLSGMLQLLHSSAGLDSLLLVVSPASDTPATGIDTSKSGGKKPQPAPAEASWIGGTELGKEFWMGLKGGGLNGARAFRVKSQMRLEADLKSVERNITNSSITPQSMFTPNAHIPTAKIKSSDVKTELNAAVRQALRSASGNPSAEMRWTKPAALAELYDVQLVGWPPDVNMQNPSNNGVRQNRTLLDYIRTGKMRFIKKSSPEWKTAPRSPAQKDNRRIVTDTIDGSNFGGVSSNSLGDGLSNISPSTDLSMGDMSKLPSTEASELSYISTAMHASLLTPRSANESHLTGSSLSPLMPPDNTEHNTLKRWPEDNDGLYEAKEDEQQPKRVKFS